jgi:hypothetical protein
LPNAAHASASRPGMGSAQWVMWPREFTMSGFGDWLLEIWVRQPNGCNRIEL